MSVCEVAQSCLTLCDPMDCSLPGSSVRGIFQAIVLEWIAISPLRGYSQPRDQTISCISSGFFTAEPWASLGIVSSAEFSSVPQSCPTLCDPMDCSMPGFAVHRQPLELVQTHVHWVGDTIKPSYPLLSPSPPVFNLSQHQGLFQWVQMPWS